jgi:hypothetical protein
MSIYFLLLDAHRFQHNIVPALAASWQERSFVPCRELCAALAPEAAAYCERYYSGSAEPFIGEVARGLAFNRDLWRLLVGEVLLYAAAELPEIQTAPDTLRRLLQQGRCPESQSFREHYSPIEQVHFGSRDLVFGRAYYRPESAGYNDDADVERLAAFLDAVDPALWSAADLHDLPGVDTPEDREEELEFARDWFPSLRDMYREAQRRGQIIICESQNSPPIA